MDRKEFLDKQCIRFCPHVDECPEDYECDKIKIVDVLSEMLRCAIEDIRGNDADE